MKHAIVLIPLLLLASLVNAQMLTVSGVVTDANDKSTIPGVNVTIKGTTDGTITGIDGDYSISVKKGATLVFSFIGMETQEVRVTKSTINIALDFSSTALKEFVTVGYGVQKKESVVGAIVQASSEELMQSGGVSTVGQALTGKLPGVQTISGTGRPGDESPEIFIRGQSSWNGDGQPLIIVDGVEREMNDIDVGDVESISVLKDASATAVYGVKGGNGVILITTKRGQEGRAKLNLSANSTFKVPSKIPQKYDSYNGFKINNEILERVVSGDDAGWDNYKPLAIMEKYRNPANRMEEMLYPDVDWVDAMTKDFAMDHRVNLSVSGGTKIAKYFGSLTYQHVGDIFSGVEYSDGRGYEADFRYDRFNYRSNIDFDITKSTRFSVNLSGFYGVQKDTEGFRDLLYTSIYQLAPNLYYPKFDDGTYGNDMFPEYWKTNPAMLLSAKGSVSKYRIQANSDFMLEQKLDFILKGLKFSARFSYDNNFAGKGGIQEHAPTNSDNVIYTIVNEDGTTEKSDAGGTSAYTFALRPWTRKAFEVHDWDTKRRLFYQFNLNYDRTFADKHTLSVLALMNREEYTQGSKMPTYREDWVGRITYNYDTRYFLDVNGAYNGSEQFGDGYKFALFPSVAAGWMISNEAFLKNVSWLEKLKIRGSYGLVGDDRTATGRWLYTSQWGSGGTAVMDYTTRYYDLNDKSKGSPYTFSYESIVGNPDLHWETSTKANIGFETGLFHNMFAITYDWFYENRYDILLEGKDRSVSSIYGIDPAVGNVGETEVRGFELAIDFYKQLGSQFSLWSNFAYSVAKDKIIYKEEPFLKESYTKAAGYAIGQQHSQISDKMMESWDDIYASIPLNTDQEYRRPGTYDVIDFNGDGVIDKDDETPYGFTYRPENTYNLTLGVDFRKSWSFMVQFYGANNATKNYIDRAGETVFFTFLEDYWSVDNRDGELALKGGSASTDPYRNKYDASYLKLKNIELSYKFKAQNGSQYKLYVNANDLFYWSDLPDDRQLQKDGDEKGAYPTFRRFNIGLNINF